MGHKLNYTAFNTDPFKDPNSNYETFEKIISDSREKYLPFKKKRFDKYKHKLSPWITAEIIDMIKFKDSLYKKLKFEHSESNEYASAKINLNNYSKLLQKNHKTSKEKLLS